MSPAPLQPGFVLLTQWLSCSTVTFDSVHVGSSQWCAGKRDPLERKREKKKHYYLLFLLQFLPWQISVMSTGLQYSGQLNKGVSRLQHVAQPPPPTS